MQKYDVMPIVIHLRVDKVCKVCKEYPETSNQINANAVTSIRKPLKRYIMLLNAKREQERDVHEYKILNPLNFMRMMVKKRIFKMKFDLQRF